MKDTLKKGLELEAKSEFDIRDTEDRLGKIPQERLRLGNEC